MSENTSGPQASDLPPTDEPQPRTVITPSDLLHGFREEMMLAAQEHGMPIYKDAGSTPTDAVPVAATEVRGGVFIVTLSNGQRLRVQATEYHGSDTP